MAMRYLKIIKINIQCLFFSKKFLIKARPFQIHGKIQGYRSMITEVTDLQKNIFFKASDYETVEFHDGLSPRIFVKPMYYELGFSVSPKIFGRRVVLEKLINALSFLPENAGFLIWDVYRCREVQAKLFSWMREQIRVKMPELTDEENYRETQKYMSAPSKIGDDYCPPHLSGGAIDLTLCDLQKQTALDMGTIFDDCTERAHSHYFDNHACLNAEEVEIKKRREILKNAMESVGFVSYQYEWWHFDIGNIFWSGKTGNPPVFSALFGDDGYSEAIKI